MKWLLALILAGCASAAPTAPATTSFTTADPELASVLQEATDRMSAATGREDIALSEDGIRVTLRDEVLLFGKPVCAATFKQGDTTFIDVARNPPAGYCMPRTATILHEMIHALSPDAEHTDTGLFRQHAGNAWTLDEASLSRLCEGFECHAFQPEP